MASASLPGSSRALVERNAAADKPELDVGRGVAFFWLGVLTLIYFFDNSTRLVVSSMFPAIKAEFHLTDAQLGLLGGGLSLVLAALVVPSAALVDKWSRKYMISIMVLLWSIATWSTAFVTNYVGMLVARSVVGVGEAGYNPASYALIAAWFPRKMRALAVGIFTMGQPISGVMAIGFGGVLAMQFGWRTTLSFFAVPGLLLALVILFAPDYKTKRVELGAVKEVKPSFMEAARYSFHSRTLVLIYLSQAFTWLWAGAFTSWLPSFIGRAYNLNMAQAGQMVMIAFGVAIFGPPLGGWFADRMCKRHVSGRVITAVILVTLATILWTAVFVAAISHAPLQLCVGIWAIAQFCTAANYGCPVSAALDLQPPQYRGVSQSFIPLITNFVMFFAATVVGVISDQVGLTVALFAVMLLGHVPGGTILWLACRSYGQDREKAQALGQFVLEQK